MSDLPMTNTRNRLNLSSKICQNAFDLFRYCMASRAVEINFRPESKLQRQKMKLRQCYNLLDNLLVLISHIICPKTMSSRSRDDASRNKDKPAIKSRRYLHFAIEMKIRIPLVFSN